jgi:hypothetical protein
MKELNHTFCIVALCLLLPIAAHARNNFEGTWKTVPHTFHTTATLTQVLEDGHLRVLDFANGSDLTLKADGTFHKVKGIPYFDAAAMHVVDARTVNVAVRRNGKKVANSVLKVSRDGKTMVLTRKLLDPAGNVTKVVRRQFKRLKDGPRGAHAISGTWRPMNGENISNTYHLDGDVMHARDSVGHSYQARLGGKDAILKGGYGEHVTVSTLGPHILREAFSKNGKVTDIYLTITAASGETARVIELNLPSGDTSSWSVARK